MPDGAALHPHNSSQGSLRGILTKKQHKGICHAPGTDECGPRRAGGAAAVFIAAPPAAVQANYLNEKQRAYAVSTMSGEPASAVLVTSTSHVLSRISGTGALRETRMFPALATS